MSDCKAINQDSQAIGGFNGPGTYLIENNYLEGAGENVLLGGGDPKIPGLVTTDVRFLRNHLRKPLSWRDPIVATPAAVSANPVPGGGSLAAGTYYYKVAARAAAGGTNNAVSKPAAEVSATIAAGSGGVSITWTPVAGAAEYLVYGRAAGAENVYWTTTNPYFTDSGASGTGGSPNSTGTRWSVKNIFELKNAQDVLVEGNVFENLWVADQPGYPIVFTPRNQSGAAPWVVVQRVIFRNNLVRHTAGGVNILGTDNIYPSQRTNHITVSNNLFDDLTAATWGSGSRPFIIGDGPDTVTIDRNTVISTNSAVIWLYGGSATAPKAVTNAVITDNMAAHNSYGIMGSSFASGLATINAYLPGAIVNGNVLAGGTASRYPTGNFFPTVAAWRAEFVDYAQGDYHLVPQSPYTGRGADIDAITAQTVKALSGDNSAPAGAVIIITTNLPDGVLQQPYSQPVECTGGVGGCAWRLITDSLPAGIDFDATAGLISGVPSEVRTGSISLEAYDPTSPANNASTTLTLKIGPPAFLMIMPTAPAAKVGVPFMLMPTVSGAMGSVTWSLVEGTLPPGVGLNVFSGTIAGTPSSWGAFSALVQAQDSWAVPRIDAEWATITVAPTTLAISTTALPSGTIHSSYQAVLTATGGTGLTTWTLTNGALPAGLTLGANGAISGTPTALGAFSITVRAQDANWPGNVSAPRTLSLTVNSAVSAREIVLYAADATRIAGTWSLVSDASAAGGRRVRNPDAAAPKLVVALASPANYFELTFQAEAGVAYHLWMRGKADNNAWANDSVYVQFSGAVDAAGVAINRIGTTGAATVSIENGLNAGLAGWGWSDNSYGGFGSSIYFQTSGLQTLRVQVREDGLSLDQIVLSADRYATSAPGATKNDTTIVAK